MRIKKISIAVGIVFVLCLLQTETVFARGVPGFVQNSGDVVLNINTGTIRGLKAEGVYSYKGIPYAKEPVGQLRFAPPQDAQPWEGVLDCTKYGALVTQWLTSPRVALDNKEQSEGALILNVWTPSKPNTSDKLPVYVFIHGGGYEYGTGNQKTFDGTSFAKNGIVAVTINYRLSTLGFFASQETYNQYGTTGNWGILDQIKALEWVRDNIAAFGGDPDKVTIGGESAGSWSVSALILSPLAKGLFRSAIMESGTILSLNTFLPARGNLEKSIEASRQLAGIFGASDDAEGLKKMRQADADVLNHLSPFFTDQTLQMQAFFYMPVFDGTVLPKDPLAAINAGNYNKVNLLIGFNRDEGTLFFPEDADEISFKTLVTRAVGEAAPAFLERFPVDENHSATQRGREIIAYTWFTAGTKLFLDKLSPNNKVFMYQFNFAIPGNAAGAYHTSEMQYVFNTLEISNLVGAEYDKLAQEMHTRWANFIKNSDPNVGEAPPTAVNWPQYDNAKTDVLFFDYDITTGPLPDKENLDFTAELLYSIDN